MRKITDIYVNLKEKINLKIGDDFGLTTKNLVNDIDSIKKELKDIKLKKDKKIKFERNKVFFTKETFSIDFIKKGLKNINLQRKKIKNKVISVKEKFKKNFKKIRIIDPIKKGLKNIVLKKNKNLEPREDLKKNIEPFSGKLKNIDISKIIKKQSKIIIFFKNLFHKLSKLKKFNYRKKVNIKTKLQVKILKISALLFFIFSIVLIDKIIIENLVSSGIKNLYNIQFLNNSKDIKTNLIKAKTKFNIANLLFTPFKVIPARDLINAKNIIYSLQDVSQIGLDFVDFYKANKDFLKNKKINEIYFANMLANSKDFFLTKQKDLENIKKNLEKIKFNKDEYYYNKLESLRQNLDNTIKVLSLINKNYDTFLSILGKNRLKNYLVVFQNNDEIRPTGGFMGSAGFLKIFAGRIIDFEKKDIYALEWDSKINYHEKVKGPTGINMLSQRLGLRDSNAFIDFYKSAKSINYFINKAGYNIDGVIFINQKPIIDLLKEIGEIDFSKYKSKITDKNFSLIISLLVEAKISKKATLDTPKQVLFDLGDLIKQKIINSNNYLSLLKVFAKNVESRNIVFISFDKKENELLEKLNITGSFDYQKQTDFNYPFFISVGGNKTDRYMERKYFKNIQIIKNNKGKCDLISHFEIVLKHNFSKDDEKKLLSNMKKFRLKYNKDFVNIQGKGLNQTYIKVIIPEQSIIDYKKLKKYGYIVLDHKKYKTIEKLLKTSPGNKSYFNFDYKIENIDCSNQKVAIYKQSGIYNYDLVFNYNNEKIELENLEKDFKINLHQN